MPIPSKSTTRAEVVRRRRADEMKRHYQSAATAATTARPLISRPRRSTGMINTARPLIGRLKRPFALPFALPALPEVIAGWRLASLSMVMVILAALFRFMTDPQMFVTGIQLGGNNLIPGEEIYASSGVAHASIFWINPADVQKQIAAISGIAVAQVEVQWPGTVIIHVQEREPILVLQDGEKQYWVDKEGVKFDARSDLNWLLPIKVDAPQAGGTPIPLAAVQGALQLKELRKNIELLHYDAQRGLSYQDGRNWRGYFGVGMDMDQKVAVYESLVDNLMARGIYPKEISVENLQAPFYRK